MPELSLFADVAVVVEIFLDITFGARVIVEVAFSARVVGVAEDTVEAFDAEVGTAMFDTEVGIVVAFGTETCTSVSFDA